MEIMVIVVLCIVVFAIIMTDRHPTQPSFIITPVDEHIKHSNDGCLIIVMLTIGIVFIITVSTM